MTPSTPPGDWEVVADSINALRDEIARLREREAQLERVRNIHFEELEAAEARVKELEEALRDRYGRDFKAARRAIDLARITELEEALRWYADVLHANGSSGDVARRALAHEDEAPKGRVLNPPPNYSSQDQSPPPWGAPLAHEEEAQDADWNFETS